MTEKVVTIEKAIAAIKTAADEIPAEDFISYSTILDVHLHHAHEEFSSEDQAALLSAVQITLDSHEDLFRDIAWDLVSVLLPFSDSPFNQTASTAEEILESAAGIGNPREVFIKVLEALASVQWSQQTHEDDVNEDEEHDIHHSDDEAEASSIPPKKDDSRKVVELAFRKFRILLSLLQTVRARISMKVPSRFLSTELTTLYGVMVKAAEVLDRKQMGWIMDEFLGYVELVRPKRVQKSGIKEGQRPALPPRASTGDILQDADDIDGAELALQCRLLASFALHLLETYLLRTPREATTTAEDHNHGHPAMQLGDTDGRGLEVGWASKYDAEVVRKGKSAVPGGKTLIDNERDERDTLRDAQKYTSKINSLCTAFGLSTDELLTLVQVVEDPGEDEHIHPSEVGAPKAPQDVPLSKTGALFLLAERFSISPPESLQIFPDHEHISSNFMIYGPGQSQPPVLDAVLFLGALALTIGGLGDAPYEVEPFLLYLQIFAATSATSASPQTRFLAHHHVARCIRAHPNDTFRLAYIKDTLEHCPFESLKSAVISILKDEIVNACSPPPGGAPESGPNTPNTIFGSSVCIKDLFDLLFPDLSEVLKPEDERSWEAFKDLYPRVMGTVNLYYFLLLSTTTRHRLGVTDKQQAEQIEKRFLGPLRKSVVAFAEKARSEGTMEVEVLQSTLERVEEVKSKYVD